MKLLQSILILGFCGAFKYRRHIREIVGSDEFGCAFYSMDLNHIIIPVAFSVIFVKKRNLIYEAVCVLRKNLLVKRYIAARSLNAGLYFYTAQRKSLEFIFGTGFFMLFFGKIILYGIPGDGEKVDLPIKKLICEEMTVYGAVGNTKAWYPLVKMIADGKMDVASLVTHRFRLEDINKAFDLYRNHDKTLIKAVIEF